MGRYKKKESEKVKGKYVWLKSTEHKLIEKKYGTITEAVKKKILPEISVTES